MDLKSLINKIDTNWRLFHDFLTLINNMKSTQTKTIKVVKTSTGTIKTTKTKTVTVKPKWQKTFLSYDYLI